MGEKEQIMKHKPIIYLLLAFGITWACWISAIVLAEKYGFQLPSPMSYEQNAGMDLETPQQTLARLLFSFAVYGPILAAFVVTFLESGKQGIVDLIGRIVKWRVGGKWYLMVVGIAVILSLVPKLIGMAFGMTQGGFLAIGSVSIILILFLRQILSSGLGEEPGWRGYLQPYLQSRFDVNKSIWILGIIWAVWHYPITIYYTLSGISGVPLIGIVITILMSLLGQTISLVGISYIYAWVYNNTKSVLLAILFHALSNLVPAVLLGESNQTLGIFAAVMPWVVVFVLEKMYGKASFPGS